MRFNPDNAVVKKTDSYDVFTDNREVVIALPGLEPGAKSLLSYTRRTKREGLQLPWATHQYPQLGYARRHVELNLTWDDDVPTPAWHNAFEGYNCTEKNRALNCIAKDIEPAKTDSDVSYYDMWPQLQISTSKDWESIVQHELRGVNAAIADTELLDKIYDQLDESPENPVAPLWEFSARKIRYVSFSAGEHSVTPHKISKTITDLYGDCKDKSMVLLALLKRQGIKAAAALVATNRYEPEKLRVPSGHYFNHMVVCLQDEQGNVTRCLDPTNSSASSANTTSGIQGNVALLLTPGSKPFAIPLDTYHWELNVDTIIAFNSTGGQTETIERKYSTHYASWFRSRLASRSAEERTEWLIENYHDNVSASTDPDFDYAGVDNIESPVSITSRASFEDVVDPKKSLNYYEPLAWTRDLVRNFEIENKYYYYDFPGLKIQSTYRFELPGIWKDGQPGASIDLKTRYGSFTRVNTIESEAVVQQSKLELPARRLQVTEFEDFNKFLKVISRTSNMDVIAPIAKK